MKLRHSIYINGRCIFIKHISFEISKSIRMFLKSIVVLTVAISVAAESEYSEFDNEIYFYKKYNSWYKHKPTLILKLQKNINNKIINELEEKFSIDCIESFM